jgi:hypothetical protein
MISIHDGAAMQRALSGQLDPELQSILLTRLALLAEFADWDLGELAHFYIVEVGDNIEAIERELGFSPMVNFVDGARYPDPSFTPSWEHLVARGIWYDFVFALSDSGFGIILLVPERDGIEPALLELCRAFAAR